MKVIGISAKAGAGKDTAYDLLKGSLEARGYKITRLAFADKLKEALGIILGFDVDRLKWDYDYKQGRTLDDGSPDPACEMLGMNRRVIMQLFGTEAMRQGLHSDIWIIALKLAIKCGEYDGYDVGVLTDCRFLNELWFVKDMNGTLVKLERHGDVSTLIEDVGHASEIEWERWDNWDMIVRNTINSSMDKESNLKFFQRSLERAVLDRVFPGYIENKHMPVEPTRLPAHEFRGAENIKSNEWGVHPADTKKVFKS